MTKENALNVRTTTIYHVITHVKDFLKIARRLILKETVFNVMMDMFWINKVHVLLIHVLNMDTTHTKDIGELTIKPIAKKSVFSVLMDIILRNATNVKYYLTIVTMLTNTDNARNVLMDINS